MNTNFTVIGLTRLGIKPESTAQETDALTTRPLEIHNEELREIRYKNQNVSSLNLSTDAPDQCGRSIKIYAVRETEKVTVKIR